MESLTRTVADTVTNLSSWRAKYSASASVAAIMIRMLELSGNAGKWNNLGLRRNPFLSESDSDSKLRVRNSYSPGSQLLLNFQMLTVSSVS